MHVIDCKNQMSDSESDVTMALSIEGQIQWTFDVLVCAFISRASLRGITVYVIFGDRFMFFVYFSSIFL